MNEYAQQMAGAQQMSDDLWNKAVSMTANARVPGEAEEALLLAFEAGKALACANVLESPHDVLIHVGFMLAEARETLNDTNEEEE